MLIDSSRSCLIVVDVQEKLAPAVSEGTSAVANCAKLLEAAVALEVPRMITEQYPSGLGPTLAALTRLVPAVEPVEKITFSCLGEPAFRERFRHLDRSQAVLCGMETHVCVLQTGLEMRAAGGEVFVVADACGSRDPANKAAALARLERAGAEVVTTEMVLFEWLRRAGTASFRKLLPLIK